MKQIGILCSELFSYYYADLKKEIAETGLSMNQAKVLLLAGLFEDNGLSQKDMARICRTDTPAMSRTVDKLEESGYIIRKRNNEDYRCVSIRLSDSGTEKGSQIKDVFDCVYSRMFSKLSDEEEKQLVILLMKMAEESEVMEKVHSSLLSDDSPIIDN